MPQMRWARERREDNGKFAKLQSDAPLRCTDGSVALLISHRKVARLLSTRTAKGQNQLARAYRSRPASPSYYW
jgi:hypothetical protein